MSEPTVSTDLATVAAVEQLLVSTGGRAMSDKEELYELRRLVELRHIEVLRLTRERDEARAQVAAVEALCERVEGGTAEPFCAMVESKAIRAALAAAVSPARCGDGCGGES